MGCIGKRITFIGLTALIVILFIASITSGGYLMIDQLDSYNCGNVKIGIVTYFCSLLIFLIFVCCFDTKLLGLLALVGSLVVNGYLIFMIGYENGECLEYYKTNKEGEYYLLLAISNMLLVILLSLYLICVN